MPVAVLGAVLANSQLTFVAGDTSLAEFGAPNRRMYVLVAHLPGGRVDGGDAASIADSQTTGRFLDQQFVGLRILKP